MGTIFKYNNQFIQCKNLQKKLKKLKLTEDAIEIIKDNIPDVELEQTFVALTSKPKEDGIEETSGIYYIFMNSEGNYLWGINKPDITYIEKFGFDISDYKLIDTCIGSIKTEYYKWNPDTKTGRK